MYEGRQRSQPIPAPAWKVRVVASRSQPLMGVPQSIAHPRSPTLSHENNKTSFMHLIFFNWVILWEDEKSLDLLLSGTCSRFSSVPLRPIHGLFFFSFLPMSLKEEAWMKYSLADLSWRMSSTAKFTDCFLYASHPSSPPTSPYNTEHIVGNNGRQLSVSLSADLLALFGEPLCKWKAASGGNRTGHSHRSTEPAPTPIYLLP